MTRFIMKTKWVGWTGLLLAAGILVAFRLSAVDSGESGRTEYATIRWAGRDNTHIIRPGGRVEFVGGELHKMNRPERTDERAFCMNLVMNGLAKEGYEFVGMTPDEIVMKRLAR